MINSYDDLKAQRAQAHNDLQIAKSRLTADSRALQEEFKPFKVVSAFANNLFTNRLTGKAGKKGIVGTGIQLGVNAVLAKTALRRLPFPLNMILPHAVENAAINYTEEHGREWLIKGLRWVKKITEEDEEPKVLLLESNAGSGNVITEPVAIPEIKAEAYGDRLTGEL